MSRSCAKQSFALVIALFADVAVSMPVSTSDTMESCPSANGDAMMQLGSLDLTGTSHRVQSLAAFNIYLQREISGLSLSQKPAVNELDDLIGHFISHQSNSEDKCSSQLMEAKHQLNQLHVMIYDLSAEINSTQTSIQVLTVQLTSKREELETIEAWKTTELHKCEVIREERRKMLYTLQQELIEMRHIARPDVTMDIGAGTVSTGVALLENDAPEKISDVQTLVDQTRQAASSLASCVQAEKTSLIEARDPATEAPQASTDAQCAEQKEVLEKTYVQTYVELTRLVSEYQELIESRACEDTVIQEYTVKVTPVRKEIKSLETRIEQLTDKLAELRPRLEDVYNAEKKLRKQIATLTTECSSLPNTISDLDKVRDAIHVLDACPGLGAAEFNIPVWTKDWAEIRQDPTQSDADLDAAMNQACAEKFGDGSVHVRAAEVSEIFAVAIEGMPQTNTAEEAILAACPLCAGNDDEEGSPTHKDGHARVCWEAGAALTSEGAAKECSAGSRVVLCVYDRGDIRELTREELSSP